MANEETAGTPLETPQTGTPDGTAGTVDGSGGGPERSEERRYTLNVSGRDVELTESEVLQRAQRASGLEYSAEEKNRRIRELEAALVRKDLGLEEQNGYGQQGNGHRQPVRDVASIRGLESLDPADPSHQTIADLIQRQEELKQEYARDRWVNLLNKQDSDLARQYGAEYDQEECQKVVRDALNIGKRIDLKDAFFQIRGQRATEQAQRAAEAARNEARLEQQKNARMVPTASFGGGAAAAPTSDRVYSLDDVKAMQPSEYRALKEKGYAVNSKGEFSRIR